MAAKTASYLFRLGIIIKINAIYRYTWWYWLKQGITCINLQQETSKAFLCVQQEVIIATREAVTNKFARRTQGNCLGRMYKQF